MALPPGARLGHYEILAGIGAGGMGEISRARDPRLDREVVVLDTVTRKRLLVTAALPGPASEEMFAMSPGDKAIFYGAAQAASDIWIVERK